MPELRGRAPYLGTVRNIFDQVIMNQNLRTEDNPDNKIIAIEDVEDYLTDEGIDLSEKGTPKEINNRICLR